MTVTFADRQGRFTVHGVENIYHDIDQKCWNVLFEDGCGEEYSECEIIEIDACNIF